MTTVNYTGSSLFVDNYSYQWTPLTITNADGQPVGFTGSGDRTVQITGIFGAGGTVVLEGTLDNNPLTLNWFTLKGADGSTALSFTAAGLRTILENCVLVRPRVSAGDGTTSITAVVIARLA